MHYMIAVSREMSDEPKKSPANPVKGLAGLSATGYT